MRMYSRAILTSLVLIVVTITMVGCGRRGALERMNASQTEMITIDYQATPVEDTMPAQDSGAQAGKTDSTTINTTAPTATPNMASQKDSSKDRSDAQLDQLMDELETALDELEASTVEADQDALLDATLATLGK